LIKKWIQSVFLLGWEERNKIINDLSAYFEERDGGTILMYLLIRELDYDDCLLKMMIL